MGVGVDGGAHPPSPTLSGSSSCSAGRGRDTAAASTSRPLRAAQPGDRRRSRSMRCARDWRPGAVRGGPAAAWLRLGSGSAPALVAATVAAPQSRLQLPATPPPAGPRRGSAPAPARPANQARHRPSRHRPARPTAPRPKFEEGPAGACQPVRAQDAPRLALLLASRGDPPTHTWKAKG